MTDREKLIELRSEKCMQTLMERKGHVCSIPHCQVYREECTGFYADHLLANGVMFRHDEIEAILKNAEDLMSALRQTTELRWIPVSERSPELIPCNAGTAYSEAINVLTSGRKVLTALWDGFDFITDAEFWGAEDDEITHWCPVLLPLPPPPKEVPE